MDPKFFRQYADILREFGADNGPIGVAGRQPQPTTPAPQQGVSRFANTADAYDQGIDGPEGERTTINTSTGQKQISNAGGTTTVDTTRGAVPVSQSTPNIGGYQQTTYTGSAGKGPASGAQTTSYTSGPMSVTKDTDAAGKQTSATTDYDMGVAKFSTNQQGDENAPIQKNMQLTAPMQEEDEDVELQRLKEFLSKPY